MYFINKIFMLNLCKYKNIFGELRTGFHSIRIMDIAILDVLVVILLAKVFTWLSFNFWSSLCYLFLLGIISHRVFCVRTTIDKLLFL